MRIITLTTDFGNSEYVGAVKGVIYSICRNVLIVDITHNIRKFDVLHAYYVLLSTHKYFPKGTIHLAVVDPGVGTERKAVVIYTDDYIFIGPDNGIFSFIENPKEIYEIEIPEDASKTFHARDVFAPTAAKIACNLKLNLKKLDTFKKLDLKPKIIGNRIAGKILCVDDFGNIITNIPNEMIDADFGDVIEVKIDNRAFKMRFVETYGRAEKGELICLIGSGGFLEISVNQGDASKVLGIKGGENIEVFNIYNKG